MKGLTDDKRKGKEGRGEGGVFLDARDGRLKTESRV